MSELIEFELLGNTLILRDGQMLSGFVTSKAQALLLYLALTRQSHTRTALATLLWPNVPEKDAKQSLRQVLANLRKLLGEIVIADRHSVGLELTRIQVDVFLFENSAESTPRVAAAFYKGDLLSGFNVADADPFETWLHIERERLRQVALATLQKCANRAISTTDPEQAINYLNRLLAIEPWSEGAHRNLMLQYARLGRYGAALTQFSRCRQLLQDELSVEPAEETIALFHRISRARLINRTHQLSQVSEVIGRSAEIAAIRSALHKSRLVTLHGSGGIGKTTLATAVGDTMRTHFLEGVFFIPLATMASYNQFNTTLIHQLPITPQGDTALDTQIIATLKQRDCLLILDNFEQLINQETVMFLMKLIAETQEVRLLVTSRERLRLRSEFVVQIHGLAVAEDESAGIALFLHRAEWVGFRPKPQDHPSIQMICQQVEGLPLALELAAAMTAEHSCDAIASALRQTADSLAEQYHDLPPRQRSLRATFNWSWALLNSDEQRLLAKLSLFRGSFDKAAVVALIDATDTLNALVDKALVRVNQAGRYSLHEMVREYSAEKLSDPTTTAQRHAAHFGKLIETNAPQLETTQTEIALSILRIDFANIRAGWLNAIAENDLDTIAQYLDGLHLFLEIDDAIAEGIDLFTTALEKVTSLSPRDPDVNRLRCLLEIRLGRLYERMARNETAKAHLFRGLEFAQLLEDEVETVRALSNLGMCEMQQGQLRDSRSYLEQAAKIAADYALSRQQAEVLSLQSMVLQSLGEIELAEAAAEQGYTLLSKTDLSRPTAIARHCLAVMKQARGEFEYSEQLLRENLAVCLQIGDKRGESRSHYFLVDSCLERGDLEAAKAHAASGYAINEAANNLRDMAMFAHEQAAIALKLGALDEAQERFSQANYFCAEAGDELGWAITTHGLAKVLLAKGEIDSAETQLIAALTPTWAADAIPYAIDMLLTAAEIALSRNDSSWASSVISTALAHPATTGVARQVAHDLVASHALVEDSEAAKLEDLAAFVLNHFFDPIP